MLEQLNGVGFIDATRDADPTLATFDERTKAVSPTTMFSWLKAKIAAEGIGLLILDSTADVFGEEINRHAVRSFIRLLRTIGCTVVLLAHPSAEGMKSQRGYSGSTHWNNAVRSRLYLESAKAADGVEPDQDLRTLSVKKANRARAGATVTLRWTPAGFVRDERAGSSLNEMAAEQKAEEKFMELLKLHIEQGQRVSPHRSPTFAPTLFAKHPDCGGVSKRAFESAMSKLLTTGRVKIEKSGRP